MSRSPPCVSHTVHRFRRPLLLLIPRAVFSWHPTMCGVQPSSSSLPFHPPAVTHCHAREVSRTSDCATNECPGPTFLQSILPTWPDFGEGACSCRCHQNVKCKKPLFHALSANVKSLRRKHFGMTFLFPCENRSV